MRACGLAPLLLLVACQRSVEVPPPEPEAPGPGVETRVPEIRETPPFAGTAGRTHRVASHGGVAQLIKVRAARHDGFDRVVFEFAGALPGYDIEYIDRPVRACGSGDVVPLAGDAWLQVRLLPARAHTEEGQPTVAERRQKLSLTTVREIVSTCDFEAHVTWVLGVGSPNRYRVLELTSPTRLVVDVLQGPM